MTLLLAFFGGLVSCLSPCVLPVVPVFMSQVLGTSRAGFGVTPAPDAAGARALGFLLGFAGIFIALWISIGLIGFAFLQAAPDLRLPAGVAIAGLGIATMAGWRLSLPLGRWGTAGSFGSSFLLGTGVAIGWTPCIGPTLGAIITLAAAAPTVAVGAALLVAYAAGMVLPLLVIGIATSRVRPVTRFFTRHALAVRLVSGAFVVAIGALVATGAFARLAALVPWNV